MTQLERLVFSVLIGIGEAAVVYGASVGLHSEHVWPGTILGFALGTTTGLTFLRRAR